MSLPKVVKAICRDCHPVGDTFPFSRKNHAWRKSTAYFGLVRPIATQSLSDLGQRTLGGAVQTTYRIGLYLPGEQLIQDGARANWRRIARDLRLPSFAQFSSWQLSKRQNPSAD